MEIKLTWYGHGTWLIAAGEHTILLDPFLDESPTSPAKAADVNPDFILISHGHFDHVADAETIAKASGAKLIAIYEIAEWFGKKGVENRVGMNIGGKCELPFGTVEMTQARHSNSLPDGSYGGEPAGFLLSIDGKKIYFACDTGVFGDMKLIGQTTNGIDLAILPIGDLFTMGPEASLGALGLLNPKAVLPAHYNTWPPIEQDAQAWAKLVEGSFPHIKPVVLDPGGTYTLE